MTEQEITVVKIGGSLDDAEPLIAEIAARVRQGERYVLIHGAHRVMDDLATRLGHPPVTVVSESGKTARYTDALAMDHLFMAYAGKVNKRIVESFHRSGVSAVGLTGMDGGMVIGRRKESLRIVENGRPRMLHGNYLGTIESVNATLLSGLLDAGKFPVRCPP